MKIQIQEKKENKLVGRIEVTGKITFDGVVPSNEVVKETLSAENKFDKELIIIKYIKNIYSHQEANFLAYVYDNQEAKNKMEVMTKHLRKKAEEEKKKAAEKKEKAEEKPKEEPKVEEKGE